MVACSCDRVPVILKVLGCDTVDHQDERYVCDVRVLRFGVACVSSMDLVLREKSLYSRKVKVVAHEGSLNHTLSYVLCFSQSLRLCTAVLRDEEFFKSNITV